MLKKVVREVMGCPQSSRQEVFHAMNILECCKGNTGIAYDRAYCGG